MNYARRFDNFTSIFVLAGQIYLFFYLIGEAFVSNANEMLLLCGCKKNEEGDKDKCSCKKFLKFLVHNAISLGLFISYFGAEGYRGAVNDIVNGIIHDMGNIKQRMEGSGGSPFEDEKWLADFDNTLSEAQMTMHGLNVYFLVIIALFTVKMMLLFMETEKVYVIPNTMIKSLPAILNLMIVIFAIISAFAAMAMVCYGHSFARWTSPGKMLMEVYQMMLGDWGNQYEEMY